MSDSPTTTEGADLRNLSARERFDRGLPIDPSRGRTVNVTVLVNAKPADAGVRAPGPVG